jgi:hypothetical protein
LPSNLSTIVRDLEDIRSHVQKAGGELVVSSFFWLVYDGMQSKSIRDQTIHDFLSSTYFPYRYGEIARVVAFENRVFEKIAKVHGLHFIDVARLMPRDPNLFFDPFHGTYPGIRLHAWIATQRIAPFLLARIKEGRLPRPPAGAPAVHPAFPANERTALINCSPAAEGFNDNVKLFAPGLAVPPP